MTNKIRVLIVDDSALMRKLIARMLSVDSQMLVADFARDGEEALSKLPTIQADIVLLDLEMAGLGGLETITRIRANYGKLPILVFSSHTQRGGKQTLAALSRGANDYVAKPQASAASGRQLESTGELLVTKIKALVGILAPPSIRGTAGPPSAHTHRIDIVALGASTGGPAALENILSQLPASFPVPVVIVQHMPPKFTLLLARNLARRTALDVQEAYSDLDLLPGHVYIAPGNYHLTIQRTRETLRAVLNQNPPEHESRPSVDVLFRSVAAACPGRALGVILTGMGRDGRSGSKSIIDAGGIILAQDEESSLIWGMPGAVVAAGYAHQTLALSKIASAIEDKVSCRTPSLR